MEFLKDQKNKLSMTRVVNCFVLGVIIIIWAIICLSKMEFVDFPMGVSSVLLILVVGKVGEKFIENK